MRSFIQLALATILALICSKALYTLSVPIESIILIIVPLTLSLIVVSEYITDFAYSKYIQKGDD